MSAEGEAAALSVLPSRKVLGKVDELVDSVVVKLSEHTHVPGLVSHKTQPPSREGGKDMVKLTLECTSFCANDEQAASAGQEHTASGHIILNGRRLDDVSTQQPKDENGIIARAAVGGC